MTGSITDGEDVVQDTLARTFYALGTLDELPVLRPWLFRVAHNASIDFARRRQRSPIQPVAAPPEVPADDGVDPDTVRAALATFLMLPPLQRSVVILKDVCDYSGAEIAETLGTTMPAVKAALVRGRERLRRLRVQGDERRVSDSDESVADAPAVLEEYVRLFNAGDWGAVRSLLAEEVRLDLVSVAKRKGKPVGFYFERYAAEPDVRLSLGTLDGRSVLWAFVPKRSERPRYLVELERRGDRVSYIRDYRYIPYIANEIALAPHRIGH